MRMQVRALRDAGERAEIGCERGALKFWLRSGTRARRIPARVVRDAAREYFAELRADALLVANSQLVAAALCSRFGAAPERVVVQHPGFQAARFNLSRAAELRASARRDLGVAPDAPLVGLITSGDFEKRGLDVFVAAAEQVTAGRPDARFLVVGSKSLPTALR